MDNLIPFIAAAAVLLIGALAVLGIRRHSAPPHNSPHSEEITEPTDYYLIRKATIRDAGAFRSVLKTGRDTILETCPNENPRKACPSRREVMRAIKSQHAYVVELNLGVLKEGLPPSESDAIEDLARKNGADRIVGVFTLDPWGDKAYAHTFGAQWINPDERRYAALHWLTVIPEFRGWDVGEAILDEAVRLTKTQANLSIRADVYEENIPMRKLLERYGFSYCGRMGIHNRKGHTETRAAYELTVN